MGIPTQVEQLPNPQYIEGTPRIVLEVLSDLLPSGQAIQLADAFDTEGMTDESIANAPYRWMGYSLLVTFLTSVLGIALFRKKKKFDEEKAINFQISQACEISTHYSVETENVSDISVRIAC